MNFVIPAHIPEDYIPDAQERLNWYKALAAARSEGEAQDLALEVKDRFGKWPAPLASFLAALELKRELVRLCADRADLRITSYNVCYTKLLRSWPPRSGGAA